MTEAQPEEITFEMMREVLYSAVVSDALDGLGYKNQSPRIQIPPRTTGDVLVGRCKTTAWEDIDFEDPSPYELELKAVDECTQDDVLICAANGSMHSGIWGELLSTAASNRGCVGAIVDGAVRDITKMTEMGFNVYARSTCVYDSLNRQRVIAVDEPVQIDGVTFSAGDVVIADRDGVVVIPREIEDEAIKAAWVKVHSENVTRDAIKNGMLASEVYEKYGVL